MCIRDSFGIDEYNDHTDPTNSVAELPALALGNDAAFRVALGIGDLSVSLPTDFFSLKHDLKSDWLEIAYLVTPAVMPDTGTPGSVSLTIGLHGAESNTPLPNLGVTGPNEPIPIPFFFPLCDFDTDGDCDLMDIDALVGAVAANDAQFDLNGDTLVDVNDVETWLDAASRDGEVFVRGDAKLDGVVDPQDLNRLGKNWLTPGDYGWSGGDFDGNGIADSEDLNVIGLNWQHGASFEAAVPEPKVPTLIWALVFLAIRGRAQRAMYPLGHA